MYLCPKECENYYCAQIGGGDNYFRGITHQRGYGFFGDLKRHISPLLFKAGRYLAKNIFETGKKVASDVASGAGFKESAKRHFGETTKNIQADIFEKLQRGQGIKRKRKNKTRQKQVKRRAKRLRDIFD